MRCDVHVRKDILTTKQLQWLFYQCQNQRAFFKTEKATLQPTQHFQTVTNIMFIFIKALAMAENIHYPIAQYSVHTWYAIMHTQPETIFLTVTAFSEQLLTL